MAKFKPLQDYVLITPDKTQTVTKSGVLVPTKTEDKKDSGVVVDVGPDVKTLKKGDHVSYRQWPREEIEVDGESVCLTKVENIIGIYE